MMLHEAGMMLRDLLMILGATLSGDIGMSVFVLFCLPSLETHGVQVAILFTGTHTECSTLGEEVYCGLRGIVNMLRTKYN